MIIAIYGKSCTGKTSVARCLAKIINAEVRHCSEEIRNLAEKLKCMVNELSQEEHIKIDNETRKIASSFKGTLIIEGIFLSHVLEGLTDVFWVELICNNNERRLRHQIKQGQQKIKTDISERDISDNILRKKLFKEKAPYISNILIIDSTTKSAEAIASLIAEEMSLSNVNKT